MKKSFVLLLTLVLLIFGTAYYAQMTLLNEKDQVHYTETILYGDKDVVDGTVVELDLGYRQQLYWHTTYEIGATPKEQTMYTFYPWYHQIFDYSYAGSLAFLNNSRNIRVDEYEFESEKELTGLHAAMKKLYKETEPGTSKIDIVYLKDFEEYYTFDLEVSLPRDGNMPSYSYGYYNKNELIEEIALLEETGGHEEQLKEYKEALKVWEGFESFFKIPVLDTELAAIGISKDTDGHVSGWAISDASGGSCDGDMNFIDRPELQGADSFDFGIQAIFDDENCYFTFYPYTRNDKLVDVSQILGGYGIYSFKYDKETRKTDIESLHTVYEWNPEYRLENLILDENGQNLLLFTEDEFQHRLDIIDKNTMALVDTFELGTKEAYLSSWSYEDFLVVAGENVMVFSVDENGKYTQVFSVNKEEVIKNISSTKYGLELFGWSSYFDWNGETLLMIDKSSRIDDEYRGLYTCNFVVAAVDKTGLLYYGLYESSLDTFDLNYTGCYFDRNEENPFQIHWKSLILDEIN